MHDFFMHLKLITRTKRTIQMYNVSKSNNHERSLDELNTEKLTLAQHGHYYE